MLLKHIVVGLLLNTISITQAAGANSSINLNEKEISDLYSEHYQTKEKLLRMHAKFKLGPDKKLTKE